jgi:hypothetical protein
MFERILYKSNKNFRHVLIDLNPLVLSFRFHFYPADPTRLSFNGKCMLFQQLKRDLIHGRLYCSAGEAAALGALIVQGELKKIQIKFEF